MSQYTPNFQLLMCYYSEAYFYKLQDLTNILLYSVYMQLEEHKVSLQPNKQKHFMLSKVKWNPSTRH